MKQAISESSLFTKFKHRAVSFDNPDVFLHGLDFFIGD
jgi:hypothetical protein